MEPIMTQAAITHFPDIQRPRIAGHREMSAAGLHVAREGLQAHPGAGGTLPKRFQDDAPPAAGGRHLGLALAGLPLDGADPLKFVEFAGLEPARPESLQHLGWRFAQRLAASLGQGQFFPAQFRQTACLHQHGPGLRLDRTDFFITLRILGVRRVKITLAQQRRQLPQGGRAGQQGLVADRQFAPVDQPQHGHHFGGGIPFGIPSLQGNTHGGQDDLRFLPGHLELAAGRDDADALIALLPLIGLVFPRIVIRQFVEGCQT